MVNTASDRDEYICPCIIPFILVILQVAVLRLELFRVYKYKNQEMADDPGQEKRINPGKVCKESLIKVCHDLPPCSLWNKKTRTYQVVLFSLQAEFNVAVYIA